MLSFSWHFYAIATNAANGKCIEYEGYSTKVKFRVES